MNTTSSALSSAVERFRSAHYTDEEIAEICRFLEKFCETAIIYLTNLFVNARIYKYPRNLHTVLLVCDFYDYFVWRHSSPDRYGDPDDTSVDEKGECRGARNAGAIAKVYGAIGLPLLKGIH